MNTTARTASALGAFLAASALSLPSASAAFINEATKEIDFKVVYYGPADAGQTATLRYLYDHTAPDKRGNIVTFGKGAEETVHFQFVPGMPPLRGYTLRFYLYAMHAPEAAEDEEEEEEVMHL